MKNIKNNPVVRNRSGAATIPECSVLSFRSLVENVNDVLFAFTPDGVICYLSPQWHEASGHEINATIGHNFMDFVHVADIPVWQSALKQVAANGGKMSGIEYRILCKDNSYHWRRANISQGKDPVTGTSFIFGVGRDIAELKQMEATLEETREKIRCLSEAAYEAIFISEKGRCLDQNTRAEELFGYTKAEAIGRFGTEWIVPEDRHKVQQHMLNGHEQPYEVTALRKDSSTFPALIRGKMMNLKGCAIRVTSMTDITDRVELKKHREHLEELVQERTAELERVNKALADEIQQSEKFWEYIEQLNNDLRQRSADLELANRELEAFSYSVSHDLQGPLRRVANYSRILKEDHGDKLDSEASTCLNRIDHAVNSMGRLINSLLQLSNINRSGLTLEMIDLTGMATEISAELKDSAPKRQVKFDIEANLAAMADLNLIRSVLQNLLGNAWKYTCNVSQATISFSAAHKDGQAIYCVSDNGAGFDMAYASNLFSAFQRLHGAEYEGSGIGLATVQRIIGRHGGTIWFEAEPDKGARFFFTLTPRGDNQVAYSAGERNPAQ